MTSSLLSLLPMLQLRPWLQQEPTLPPIATSASEEELYKAIQAYAKACDYAFVKTDKKRTKSRHKGHYYCDCGGSYQAPSAVVRETATYKTNCKFSIRYCSSTDPEDRQELQYLTHCPDTKFSLHNYDLSTGPAAHSIHQRKSVTPEIQEDIWGLLDSGNLLTLYYIIYYI